MAALSFPRHCASSSASLVKLSLMLRRGAESFDQCKNLGQKAVVTRMPRTRARTRTPFRWVSAHTRFNRWGDSTPTHGNLHHSCRLGLTTARISPTVHQLRREEERAD
ncbi:hypothetical protein BD311DRAFT_334141 [Dichomitus squalens]|uniref:Uncharacterized protein n=1 Tax=Dichomitus squalens TaxID=114155 RepID=A0A4Q9MM35_9APHY|nr:hypothetical protein BD311DRAFT_334141 [Dichomitus squalens]